MVPPPPPRKVAPPPELFVAPPPLPPAMSPPMAIPLPPPPMPPPAPPVRAGLSKAAIVSLLLALTSWIPLTGKIPFVWGFVMAPVGLLLGLIGLAVTGNPRYAGRGAAIWGVLLGIASVAGWGALGRCWYNCYEATCSYVIANVPLEQTSYTTFNPSVSFTPTRIIAPNVYALPVSASLESRGTMVMTLQGTVNGRPFVAVARQSNDSARVESFEWTWAMKHP